MIASMDIGMTHEHEHEHIIVTIYIMQLDLCKCKSHGHVLHRILHVPLVLRLLVNSREVGQENEWRLGGFVANQT